MFATIIAWLKREEQSVEQLIAGSTKLITQLEARAIAQVTKVIEHDKEISRLFLAKAEATTEGNKAQDIANKLKGLFS